MIPDGLQYFLDNFWIFKIALNLDHHNGQFWTRTPCIYGFYYTRILQNILESIWGHLQKILFVLIWISCLSILEQAGTEK